MTSIRASDNPTQSTSMKSAVRYRDRKEAALTLADELERFGSLAPIVLGIPRGGVETAYHVASRLDCEMDVIITRKLGYPYNPECAFGAICEEEGIYIVPNPSSILTREIIESVRDIEKEELDRRRRLYRQNRPLPDMQGRTILLVDDGIATGSTVFASLETIRRHSPKAVIVAAPVCSESMKKTLQSLADHVVILQTPGDFHAVSQIYTHFPSLNDNDVLNLLKKHRLDRQKSVKMSQDQQTESQ